jgi:hypothetical protein
MTRSRIFLGLTIITLTALSAAYWAKGFTYLIHGREGAGAIDLHKRWLEQQYVFHRQNPFDSQPAADGGIESNALGSRSDPTDSQHAGERVLAGYPPWALFSGYFLYWPSWPNTRLFYAAIQLVCLLWLVSCAYRQGLSADRHCAALSAAAMAATASFCTTLANGQYGILVITLLAAAMQLDDAAHPIAAGLLAGIACLKPTLSGPFLLIYLARKRWSTIACALGYMIIASCIVWYATHASPMRMIGQMIHGGEGYANAGYGPLSLAIGLGMNVRVATPLVGLGGAALTLIACILLRDRPSLQLLALTGVAARFWTYHQTYDNLVVVFLLIALTRAAWEARSAQLIAALIAVGLTLWLPAKFTDQIWFQLAQCLIWITGLAILLRSGSGGLSLSSPGKVVHGEFFSKRCGDGPQ